MLKPTALGLLIGASLCSTAWAIPASQLDALGNGLDVQYQVLDNKQDDWRSFTGNVAFTNQSTQTLPKTGWTIYFSHIRMINSIDTDQLKVSHVNGDLFKLEPTDSFVPLAPGDQLVVGFNASDWQVAKSDIMPNWYLASDDETGTHTALITSTSNHKNGQVPTKPDDELTFVGDFDTPAKWKRYGGPLTDHYDPFTAEQRYARNADLSLVDTQGHVLPTPASRIEKNGHVTLDSEWTVVYDNGYQAQAQWLADQLGISATDWAPTKQKVIHVGWGKVTLNGSDQWHEAYRLDVQPEPQRIEIDAPDEAGALYAAQSLLQLKTGDTLKAVSLTDAPRFAYRGLSVDAARNFRSKEAIFKLLDQMAALKLNKLHLRLSDDEAWRIEIPALPELADVGSKRCHDLSETNCVLPFLGAGPDGTEASNGYYTTDDYQAILRKAEALNITVIPEVDMPGHAHAAIKAMEARYHKFMAQGDEAKAKEYLLTDFEDDTQYLSVQMFTDNAMNVCMESSYRFVDTVVNALVDVHRDIQPLDTFHFGGDEIAGAWKASPVCQAFIADNDAGVNSVDDLSQYFVERISHITQRHQLDLGGWEDGLMHNNKVYPRAQLANEHVYGNAWQNIWEWGVADRAYNLANNGYGVIYNQATHLYFDHPYEPDPSERGYYWAPRFTDTRKTFSFMPDDLYANADEKRNGAPITKQEVLDAATVKTLTRPENVLGLQASIWSETIRSDGQFESMTFPRLFAMAERAWHRAEWEASTQTAQEADQTKRKLDYNLFANQLANYWFPQLEQQGVGFRLPVPGGVIESGTLKANSPFPGLTIEYSTDNGASWQAYDADNAPHVSAPVQLRTISGERVSRISQIQ
ncbi:family 20 glycosylhydrolase [Salinivibrio kushneri]|uniref:family 20 glycosylhydrolase n=1 Tax=Salinivibrio kushneri TaxID=1908198 RepID=UPI000C82DA1D|nr:family 20 glycosylhydrolase [Salinivibrio kushneri]